MFVECSPPTSSAFDTAALPTCAGILALSATRVLVGLGEGFAPSAATNVLARLVPEYVTGIRLPADASLHRETVWRHLNAPRYCRATRHVAPCRRERARAVTVVFGSLDIGSAVGLVICGPLIATAGWPSVFYLFAVLGLAWCLWWPLLKPESSDPAVSMDEQAAPQAATAAQAQPAGGLLGAESLHVRLLLSELSGERL
jgi:MFS transporter, ACS family, solute carrier family 17 (sodium-dependent inorganic phosphate cotransporter), other